MIRFKTIDPAQAEKPAARQIAPSQVAPAPIVATQERPEPAGTEAPATKGKGMTRKTPLRARKPEAARLFRD